ncbi:MAG TPA: hypothetical protein VHK88_09955 [Aquihabitans sp.]|jgi:hypothetical protein|nr:hypothetical protein [Aquihabitans sp.]
MSARLRRPVTWIWFVAVLVAVLIGLAIGGFPVTSRDVPLDERKVEAPT